MQLNRLRRERDNFPLLGFRNGTDASLLERLFGRTLPSILIVGLSSPNCPYPMIECSATHY